MHQSASQLLFWWKSIATLVITEVSYGEEISPERFCSWCSEEINVVFALGVFISCHTVNCWGEPDLFNDCIIPRNWYKLLAVDYSA